MNKREEQLKGLLAAASVHISNTFAVTTEEADDHARQILELIEAKGGDAAEFDQLDLIKLIDSHCSRYLPWKNESRKKVDDENRKKSAESYNEFLNLGRNIWERKW